MEYQQIIKLVDNTPNQQKKRVKINDDARGTYSHNRQIKFKTTMLRSSLCDYSDVYIFVSGTTIVATLAAGGENNNRQVVFKSCAPFSNCISEINNTQIDKAKDINVVMQIYDFIEYSDNYSKTSGIL